MLEYTCKGQEILKRRKITEIFIVPTEIWEEIASFLNVQSILNLFMCSTSTHRADRKEFWENLYSKRFTSFKNHEDMDDEEENDQESMMELDDIEDSPYIESKSKPTTIYWKEACLLLEHKMNLDEFMKNLDDPHNIIDNMDANTYYMYITLSKTIRNNWQILSFLRLNSMLFYSGHRQFQIKSFIYLSLCLAFYVKYKWVLSNIASSSISSIDKYLIKAHIQALKLVIDFADYWPEEFGEVISIFSDSSECLHDLAKFCFSIIYKGKTTSTNRKYWTYIFLILDAIKSCYNISEDTRYMLGYEGCLCMVNSIYESLEYFEKTFKQSIDNLQQLHYIFLFITKLLQILFEMCSDNAAVVFILSQGILHSLADFVVLIRRKYLLNDVIQWHLQDTMEDSFLIKQGDNVVYLTKPFVAILENLIYWSIECIYKLIDIGHSYSSDDIFAGTEEKFFTDEEIDLKKKDFFGLLNVLIDTQSSMRQNCREFLEKLLYMIEHDEQRGSYYKNYVNK